MKKFIGNLILLVIAIISIIFCLLLIFFPELILPTWKYQMIEEVKAGEPAMVEYYEARYLSRGIELF